MADMLLAKYGNKGEKKKRKMADMDIPEDEFQAVQQGLLNKRNGSMK